MMLVDLDVVVRPKASASHRGQVHTSSSRQSSSSLCLTAEFYNLHSPWNNFLANFQQPMMVSETNFWSRSILCKQLSMLSSTSKSCSQGLLHFFFPYPITRTTIWQNSSAHWGLGNLLSEAIDIDLLTQNFNPKWHQILTPRNINS